MTSPLLDLPGAVAADGIDAPVAAHYGSFNGEQRTLESRRRLRRPVPPRRDPGLRADRLTWLHSLTTQHLERLAPEQWTGADPQPAGPRRARVLRRTTTARSFTAHTEPGAAAAARGVPRPDALHDAGRGRRRHRRARVTWRPGRGPTPATSSCPRDQLTTYAEAAGPACGLWAFEALRIARGEPRLGLDTDHRTIPNEAGWIGPAVHLDKGCYRGQETVARVHTLGRPPRRLTLLHLDGSENRLPAVGADAAARRQGRRLRRHLGPPPRARPDRAGHGQAQRAPRRDARRRRHAGRAGGPRRPRGRPARAPAALRRLPTVRRLRTSGRLPQLNGYRAR